MVENCHGDFGFISNIIRRILHALRYAILERRLDGMPFCMPYWSEGEGKSLGEISILPIKHDTDDFGIVSNTS